MKNTLEVTYITPKKALRKILVRALIKRRTIQNIWKTYFVMIIHRNMSSVDSCMIYQMEMRKGDWKKWERSILLIRANNFAQLC